MYVDQAKERVGGTGDGRRRECWREYRGERTTDLEKAVLVVAVFGESGRSEVRGRSGTGYGNGNGNGTRKWDEKKRGLE